MKAILEFDLPDDQYEFDQCTKASDMASALWDMDQFLRAEYKYNENEAAHPIREKFFEILSDNDLVLDKIMQ